MTFKKNLLKERIKAKIHRNKSKLDRIDFRKLRGHPTRYPAVVPTFSGIGLREDDLYHIGEQFFRQTGNVLGKSVFGYTKRESEKQNLFLQNIKWLEHKTHHTHSGLRKTEMFINRFDKVSFIDTPEPIIRKRVWNIIKG